MYKSYLNQSIGAGLHITFGEPQMSLFIVYFICFCCIYLGHNIWCAACGHKRSLAAPRASQIFIVGLKGYQYILNTHPQVKRHKENPNGYMWSDSNGNNATTF